MQHILGLQLWIQKTGTLYFNTRCIKTTFFSKSFIYLQKKCCIICYYKYIIMLCLSLDSSKRFTLINSSVLWLKYQTLHMLSSHTTHSTHYKDCLKILATDAAWSSGLIGNLLEKNCLITSVQMFNWHLEFIVLK